MMSPAAWMPLAASLQEVAVEGQHGMGHEQSSGVDVVVAAPRWGADGERVRRLLVDHLGEIARYLGRLGIPPAEVDDAAQEVFLVAASKLAGVPTGSDRSFLYAIASRVAQNARRANLRRTRAYERYTDFADDPAPTQEELSDGLRARALFDAALRDMTPDLRAVFLLCEVEGLPVPEIARRLSVPVGTAASRLRRAREAFSERVKRTSSARAPSSSAHPFSNAGEAPEILSWWVSDGEVDALRALLDVYRRSHPGASVIHGGIRDTENAKVRVSARMTEGLPPDTFQVNGGQELFRWARGARLLEPLEFLFEREHWRSVFPPDILDLVSYGGEAYAVPLNIHRTNSLAYDVQVFAEAGLPPPRTLDEFHATCQTLRRRGVNPLALGTRQAWMLSLLAFENILVSLAGPHFYLDFFEGRGRPRAPEIRAAVEELGRLLDAANPDAGRLAWDEAADRVRVGGAAMTIGGDWTKGYLERRGCLEGEHFLLAPSPGTERSFVFTIDTFGLPRGAKHRAGAIDLLRVFGSQDGQSVFNRIKGSRPARSDVRAPSPMGVSKRDLDTTTRVPTLTSLVPPSFSSAVDAALAAFARGRDVGEVVSAIEKAYPFIEN